MNITGQAQNKEQLENFEKSLQSNKDIKDVYVTAKPNTGPTAGRNRGSNRGAVNGNRPPPMGPGSPGGQGNKGFTFTITFHYKNFTGNKNR